MDDFSGKIHMYFAILCWVGIQMGVHDVFLNPIPVIIGSLLPDCDHRKTLVGKFIPMWLVCNHRGFTHTIFGLGGFSLIMALLMGVKWGVLLAFGYFLHLAMDSGTPMGIKWITGHKRRKRGKFSTVK